MRATADFEGDRGEPEYDLGITYVSEHYDEAPPDPNNRLAPYLTQQEQTHNRLIPFLRAQNHERRRDAFNEYRRMSNMLEAWRPDFERAAAGEIELAEDIFRRAAEYWNRMCEITEYHRRQGQTPDTHRYERHEGMYDLLYRVQSTQDYSYSRKLTIDEGF